MIARSKISALHCLSLINGLGGHGLIILNGLGSVGLQQSPDTGISPGYLYRATDDLIGMAIKLLYICGDIRVFAHIGKSQLYIMGWHVIGLVGLICVLVMMSSEHGVAEHLNLNTGCYNQNVGCAIACHTNDPNVYRACLAECRDQSWAC